jgi:hypothetical protein
MIVLSKTEMEDIWNNKPHGYFSSEKKRLKQYKRYSCSVAPYKNVYGTRETFVVLATSKYDAEFKARDEYMKKHDITEFKESGYFGWTQNIMEMK